VKFAVVDHQWKSIMLVRTLRAAGYEAAPPHDADVLLVDIDDPDAPGRSEATAACPGLVVLYPHGALPTYHGAYAPDERIDLQLVHGPATADAIADAGLDRDIAVVGWSYSPSVPFRKPAAVDRVLFGPHHPYGSGVLEEVHRKENRRVMGAILGMDAEEVTVHVYGTPEMNGLEHVEGVRYAQSTLNIDWAEIDDADVVIANGTFACLALARGKPVVMFGQNIPSCDEHNRLPVGPTVEVDRYPVDFSDGPLDAVIEDACDGLGLWWHDAYVGGPFDAGAFLGSIDSLVNERAAASAA
jgi:hypothetical protein